MNFPNMDIIAAALRVAYVASNEQYDEIAALEDGIAANPAQTLAEAIPQVLLAIADVRTIAPEAEGMGALIGRIERCLYSAAAVMAAEAGVSLAELGADYWSSQWQDPWVFGPYATQH